MAEHAAYVDYFTDYSGREAITKYFAGCHDCPWSPSQEPSQDPNDAYRLAREHEASTARASGIVRGEVEHNGSRAEYRARFDGEPSDEQVRALEELLRAAFDRVGANRGE